MTDTDAPIGHRPWWVGKRASGSSAAPSAMCSVQSSALDVGLAIAGVVLLAVNLRLVFGSASAAASDIRAAYHLGPASAALLTTGPVVCLGLFGPLAAQALRRWSVSSALAACLAVITAGTALRGVPSWPVLLIGTLVAGAGIAVANVLGPVFVRVFFPHRIGVMTGLFTALVSASAGIAAGATVPLSTSLLHGWRTTLFAWAGPSFVAVLVFVALTLGHHRAAAPAAGRQTTPRMRTMSVLRSPTAWAVTGFMGIQSLLAYSMIAWLPTIYHDQGLSPQLSGLTLTALSVASVLTALIVPIVATRRPNQRLLAIVVVAFSVAGLLGVLAAGPDAALVCAVLLGLGQGGQLSLALTLVNLRANDAASAADLSTMAQSIGYLIAALGPILIGVLRDATNSWTMPLLLLITVTAPLSACGCIAGTSRTSAETASVIRPARTTSKPHPERRSTR